MRIGSAWSDTPEAGLAAAEAADQAAQSLGGADCRLAVVFVADEHADDLASVAAAVDARLGSEALIGGVAQGVVGPDREIEDGPAVAVWCASWDGGLVTPFRTFAAPADGGAAVVGWPETEPDDVTILLADPHSYPAAQVVAYLGRERPGHPIVGGMLAPVQGSGRLVIGGSGIIGEDAEAPVGLGEHGSGAATHGSRRGRAHTHDGGAVGVVLRDVPVDVLVSQGCRPVGHPVVVTSAEGNLIHELAGEPATEHVRGLFAEADRDDQLLMQEGLHVGIVADEYRDHFETGDFLIRAVLGTDPDGDAIVVGDVVEVGQTVQFQVRDADSAHDDLLRTLNGRDGGVAGALLFTCNGRGERFFGEPDHDVSVVGRVLSPVLAGAFCAGEIGPVGARSFLHGFTASLAVFRSEAPSRPPIQT